jgi:predicted DNA repair protein MutK
VFWGVGLRLLLAGLKQVAQPSFTAEKIFGVTDEKAFPLVQEIGFGNLSIGLLGAVSLFQPNWVVPAALVGCIFFGLAGLKHLTQPARNRNETIAMVSDIGISAVLAIYLAAHVLTFAA